MKFINKYIGCPFEAGGRGPNSFDCWGLVYYLFKEMGIPIPSHNISVVAAKAINVEVDKQIGLQNWVKIDKPQPPCVVLIQAHPVYTQHFGFLFTHTKFVHVLIDKAVCVESILNPMWEKKIKGFYRYAR